MTVEDDSGACVSVCVCVYRTCAYTAALALVYERAYRGGCVSVGGEGVLAWKETDVAEAKEEKKEGKKEEERNVCECMCVCVVCVRERERVTRRRND